MDIKTNKELIKEEKEPVLDPESIKSDMMGPKSKLRTPSVSINLSNEEDDDLDRKFEIFKRKKTIVNTEEDRNERLEKMHWENIEISENVISQKTKFVRYVYSIVLFQVTLTFILSFASSDNYTLNRAFNNIIVIIMSYILLLGCLLVFFLTNISQVFPFNYGLLLLFTISESIVIAGWTSDMKADTIIL